MCVVFELIGGFQTFINPCIILSIALNGTNGNFETLHLSTTAYIVKMTHGSHHDSIKKFKHKANVTFSHKNEQFPYFHIFVFGSISSDLLELGCG